MVKFLETIGERNEKIKIAEERNFPIVKANSLIQKTRYNLTLVEQKVLLRLIQKIEPEDDSFKEYHFSIKEFCKMCGIDDKSGKNYEHIKNTIQTLSDKSFWLKLDDENGKREVLVRWVSKATITAKRGIIKLKLDDDLKPYLLQLKKFFTKYNYYYVMTMRSQYSIRLYELLKSYENQWVLNMNYKS